ncbi:MAG: flagellin biosynthesis protein FlgK, partial [Pyrobaculum sp.]
MRGLSTVAAFVVFLTAFAVVMFSVFYFYGVLREAALRGVQTIYASTVQDRPVEFYMSGGVCGIGGGPYFYYIVLRDYEEVHSGGSLVCPPGPGFYKYVGVERTGYLGYSFVYVGPAVLQLQSNISEVLVNRVGDVFSFDLYLRVYNNSTGWLPSRYTAELIYNSTLLSCTPASFAAPDAVVSPAALRVYKLGTVRCTVNSRFSSTIIRAVARQSYGSHIWAVEIPVVVQAINASACGCCGCPGGGGGGGRCGISPLSGARLSARLSGFNELNSWIAAWGGDSSNIVVAVRPGILVPDSTGTGTGQYYVEVTAQVAELIIPNATILPVGITGSMPNFIERLEIRVGSNVVYRDGTSTPVLLPSGKYPVTVYVRAKSNAAAGSRATLTLVCGSSNASLTFRVPQWSEWGIKVDVYSGTNFNTYKG